MFFSAFLFFLFDKNLLKSLIVGLLTVGIIFILNQLSGVNNWFNKK